MRTDIFGYFDEVYPETPAHDPGLTAPCVVCGRPLERPVKTISLIPVGYHRSYFFRAHKSCWEGISADEQNAIESSLIDELASGAVAPVPAEVEERKRRMDRTKKGWDAAAKMHPATANLPPMKKADRMKDAAAQDRIAARYRHDLKMWRGVVAALSQPSAKLSDCGKTERTL